MPTTSRKPPLPTEDKRWRIVNGTMRCHGFAHDALIKTLHSFQQYFGYLDKLSLKFVARSLRVPVSESYGVATFYHYFTWRPPGKHTCLICLGTACYIIATGHNNLAMNRGILQAARHFVGSEKLTEGMLNCVEAVIRAFGPCLSCSTYADGHMPLQMRLVSPDGGLLDEICRES